MQIKQYKNSAQTVQIEQYKNSTKTVKNATKRSRKNAHHEKRQRKKNHDKAKQQQKRATKKSNKEEQKKTSKKKEQIKPSKLKLLKFQFYNPVLQVLEDGNTYPNFLIIFLYMPNRDIKYQYWLSNVNIYNSIFI